MSAPSATDPGKPQTSLQQLKDAARQKAQAPHPFALLPSTAQSNCLLFFFKLGAALAPARSRDTEGQRIAGTGESVKRQFPGSGNPPSGLGATTLNLWRSEVTGLGTQLSQDGKSSATFGGDGETPTEVRNFLERSIRRKNQNRLGLTGLGKAVVRYPARRREGCS